MTGPSSRPLLLGAAAGAGSAAFGTPPVRAGARANARPLPAVPVVSAGPDVEDAGIAHTERSDRSPAAVAAHRRAVVLAALAVATLGSWALVALPSPVPPGWSALPATTLLVLDLVALRAAARRRAQSRAVRAAAARAAARVAPDEAPARTPSRSLAGRPAVPAAARSSAGRGSRPAASRTVASRTVRPAASGSGLSAAAATGAGPAAPAAARAVGADARGWSDRRWEDETGEIVGVERPNPLASSDGWQPVAVPPPTYTLKPVVHRYPNRSWQPVEEREFVDDLDLDEVLARRRAVNG